MVKDFQKKTGAELDDEFLDNFEKQLQQQQAASNNASSSKTYSVVDLFTNGKELILVRVCHLVVSFI